MKSGSIGCIIAFALMMHALPAAAAAASAVAGDGEARFRALHRGLVETNTSLSDGSCTIAADMVRTKLLAAGYAENATRVIIAPDFPKQGNLFAELPGSDPKAAPILLLAHLDVVEAKRADWQRDPFKLVEENGFLYGRGVVDDKAMAASFVDAFIRFREMGFKPRHTLKLALTCGEETYETFNGVSYILKTYPKLLSAGLAINEGGNGTLDANGKPLVFGIESGEKTYQDFKLVTTSPGGHSAVPGKDNAITRLANGLAKIGAYRFAASVGPITRTYFARSASLHLGQVGADMRMIGNGMVDEAVLTRISEASPLWNAMLRTTCVATMVTAGQAPNAMAQRAEADVNCRILPDQSVDAVRAKLLEVVADPTLDVSLASTAAPVSPAPPLTPDILGPVERIVARMWPGVPVIPNLLPAGTDGRFLMAAGIPTYGISGVFRDPDGDGVHGLNERVRVKSLIDSRNFLYELITNLSSH
ncbi:MAG: Acetylornithine deacetylase/succinyldiaminopimelate desuccinylase-like deacylase [Marmoricola sp.]|nr:Acetylornithine deacetylase/succinyldiaminopimelate desuccinylase-like deacylase [Marmoricola sp.]